MSNFYAFRNRHASQHIVSLVHLPSNSEILRLTESELKEVYEQLGEYIKTLPTPHPYAELMKQYAEDAATRQNPWVLWEYNNGTGWRELNTHPSWILSSKYRRKETKGHKNTNLMTTMHVASSV